MWKVTDASVVLPGTVLCNLSEPSSLDPSMLLDSSPSTKKAAVHIGPGVRMLEDRSTLVATQAGTVRVVAEKNTVWVECNQRRYVPSLEDMVVGTIVDRYPDSYKVDIGYHEYATLNALEFQGATKRNRPYLDAGDVIYARVIHVSKQTEPELSCIQPGSNKSWVSGESEYGKLGGSMNVVSGAMSAGGGVKSTVGNVVKLSTGMCRYLLTSKDNILHYLGSKLAFDTAIGLNGRVYVQSSDPNITILISLLLLKSMDVPKSGHKQLVDQILKAHF
mmetsp:Transcript_715/g.1203  ORF Transcript_715/g.1203 Transcript_715/m.1203 type:complete len:276 (-) Transcript_715:50-877(-)